MLTQDLALVGKVTTCSQAGDAAAAKLKKPYAARRLNLIYFFCYCKQVERGLHATACATNRPPYDTDIVTSHDHAQALGVHHDALDQLCLLGV